MSGFFPGHDVRAAGRLSRHVSHGAARSGAPPSAGLLLSLGLTSFLTGVTEPVEFTFMFLAPVLYALHAVATGLAMVHHASRSACGLGFSFSAGLFDYVLNFSHAQRPLLLLPIGAAYFALYYGVFRFCIVRLNLATPGRETDGCRPRRRTPADRRHARRRPSSTALGGAANLAEVDACTTRLRLVLVDNHAVDEAALKRLGARGIAALLRHRVCRWCWDRSPIKSRARFAHAHALGRISRAGGVRGLSAALRTPPRCWRRSAGAATWQSRDASRPRALIRAAPRARR